MYKEDSTSWKADRQAKQEETSVTLGAARSKGVTELWQQRMGTVVERDIYILKDDTWSDLTITVGQCGTESQVFKAHRLQVAKMSSVFAGMVYTEDNLKDEHTCIHLPDLSPDVFSSILDFIYGIKPTVHSCAHAKALLQAIDKYKLSRSIKMECEALMKKNGLLLDDAEASKAKETKVDMFKDWDWQMSALTQKDKYLLNKEKWSDCTFRVGTGENSKVFHVHRLMLAKTSPVFAVMLFGPWTVSEEIKITDVTVEAFTAFLTYTYEGMLYVVEKEFMDSGTIWDFLYLAKKYMLPNRLLDQCRAWIFANIYSNNFWTHFHYSLFLGEESLHNACKQILQQFTTFCLQLPASLDVDLKIVTWLVQSKNLECREFDLFQYCVKWAKAQLMVSQAKSCSTENIALCLKDILPHIIYDAMTLAEFSSGPAKMKFFTSEAIMKVEECIRNIEHFCLISFDQRGKDFSKYIYYFGCCREDINFLGMKTKKNTYNAFNVSILLKLIYTQSYVQYKWIDKVVIPTQIKMPINYTSSVYDEDVSVYAHDIKTGELLGIARFTGRVPYNALMTVTFSRPIHSHSKDAVLTFVPHKSGLYPSGYKFVREIVEINGSNVPTPGIEVKTPQFIVSIGFASNGCIRNLYCPVCKPALRKVGSCSSIESSSSSCWDLSDCDEANSDEQFLGAAFGQYCKLE